ncbi:glucose 1-dehydrogenase [Glycomyces albus]
MRALTVVPGKADSLTLEDRDEPDPGDDLLLVEGLAVGVCGTDREIAAAEYGWAPTGRESLVIGHESLGRVRQAPPGSGFEPGDLVAGVVRRPDPVPCGACARGQFDSCRNGAYTERGIKELDGYAAQTWTVEPGYAVRIDPGLAETGVLTEPASVVAKAWDQVDAVGNRGWYDPRTVLVTGAGPIGLLAALIGVQRGLEVHVLDIVADGPKPELVAGLGAAYHHRGIDEVLEHTVPDIVIEATGVSKVVFEAMSATGPFGVVCLTGVSLSAARSPSTSGRSAAKWSWRTTPSSARSTPASTTTRRPPTSSPPPTATGSPGSSPAASPSATTARPSNPEATTSKSSST